jgi:hypothetical protein
MECLKDKKYKRNNMEHRELETLLTKQLEKNHKLLEENNFLLRKIIEQNNLIFMTTQKNIRHYGHYWYWGESEEVKNLRQELESLLKQQ